MRITIRRGAALMLAGVLALTACGEAPEETEETTDTGDETPDETDEGDAATDDADTDAEEDETDADAEQDEGDDGAAADFLACQITDTGGVDDRSFNETVWNGFLRAEEELGVEVAYLESGSEADYEPNIQSFIDRDCDLIMTVGFLLDEATQNAAQQYPDQNFAIVDVDFFDAEAEEDISYENVRELVFQTDQAAFLAGYVAAEMTETGSVGTWGGLNIPSVSIFMNGYLAGVQYYNEENGTDVEVLGWDGNDGQFIDNFDSQDDGNNVSSALLQQGADIIMPVAGPAGLGTVAALEEFGDGAMIWVDTDGVESIGGDAADLILTSVVKRMDNAAFDTIEMALNGNFEGGLYTGTLENDGVGIAPFHEFEDEVPQETKDTLEELREGIIAGDISVEPDA